jgi:isoleucyl-tRNA synthetase
MLGNLSDNKVARDFGADKITDEIDLWALHELSVLGEKVKNAYESYELHQVYHRILAYCTVTLSNTYFDIIRDRLYCNESPDNIRSDELGEKRLSSLSSLKIIFESLLVWIAPVLSFTAEEIHQLYNPEKSVFELLWPETDKWKNEKLAKKYEKLWDLKDKINAMLEASRAKQQIKASLESMVMMPKSVIDETGFNAEELAFYLVVSEVRPKDSGEIEVVKSDRQKCARCWVFRDLNASQLCERCAKVVS